MFITVHNTNTKLIYKLLKIQLYNEQLEHFQGIFLFLIYSSDTSTQMPMWNQLWHPEHSINFTLFACGILQIQ